MRFAASNIAWSYVERFEAYALLRDNGFTGLEIAPGLLFAEEADPFAPSPDGLKKRMAELADFDLQLVSMQSLLYGVAGASLFGQKAEVEKFVYGMNRAIELAGALGIGNLVFGSPRQRIIPPDMAREEARERMRDVFLPLGDLAATHDTFLALEPNPAAYGTNFMTSFPETLEVVRAVSHPRITLNFDIGALYMTERFGFLAEYFAQAKPYVSHVHVSSANLAPAPESVSAAETILDVLVAKGYDGAVSIEMSAVKEGGLATLRQSVGRLRAAAVAKRCL